MIREKRQKGFFVPFDFTRDALDEIRRFGKSENRQIVPLTVKEILDDQIAYKLVYLGYALPMAAYPFIKVSMANGAERFINMENIVSADAFRDGTIQLHMSDGNGFTLEGIDARVVHKQLQIRIFIQIPEQP